MEQRPDNVTCFKKVLTNLCMRKTLVIFLSIFILTNILVFFTINSTSALELGGLKETAEQTGHTKLPVLKKSLPEIAGTAIKGLLTFLGVILLGLMIYGGYKWMLARGNEQEVEAAKNTIRNAIIGLIVVLGAYAITYIFKDIWVKV